MDPRRAERLSEALREELAELIEYELADPRLAGVTVTEARLVPDGRHLLVTVAVKGNAAERQLGVEALGHAASYLRRAVATRLRLFRAPELHFQAADPAGDRIGELLDRIRKNREKNEKKAGNEP
ncbi:MAG: 30S ribosome-binding factor RbfA [Bryobacteraceae bacterium]|jgi:ribosome-binding factor A